MIIKDLHISRPGPKKKTWCLKKCICPSILLFSSLFFFRNELDLHETSDKYPSNFGVCLNVKFTEETPEKMCTMPWEKMHVEKLSPYVCFSSREEYWLIHEEYGKCIHCSQAPDLGKFRYLTLHFITKYKICPF